MLGDGGLGRVGDGQAPAAADTHDSVGWFCSMCPLLRAVSVSFNQAEVELVRCHYATQQGQGCCGRPDDMHVHLQTYNIDWAKERWARVWLVVEDNQGEEGFMCLYHSVLYGQTQQHVSPDAAACFHNYQQEVSL